LFAAAAAVAAGLAARKAYAFERPPLLERRKPQPQCFLKGTRIRTPQGEVAVESLVVGDLVQSLDGSAKPVTWTGRRIIDRAPNAGWHRGVLPVKVSRSALDHLVPHADLFLSPAHCLYVGGLLVPVRNLVNGRSITQPGAFEADTIEYFHFQLADHDVVFAEGAPVETLLAAAAGAFDEPDAIAAARSSAGDPIPYAPIANARGGIVRSRLRSAIFPLMDRRQPVDIIWERIAERA
jgi:hypothetical protein